MFFAGKDKRNWKDYVLENGYERKLINKWDDYSPLHSVSGIEKGWEKEFVEMSLVIKEVEIWIQFVIKPSINA